MLSLINLLLGAGLLILGRKLFWLFIAAGGFLAGVMLATRFISGPEWLILLIGIITGIIFAVLSIFLRAFTIWLAGFFFGGSIFSTFAAALGIQNTGWTSLIIYIIGGVIGIILVSFLFDWALITLSSLAGAALIVKALNAAGSGSGIIFLVLVIVGVVIQGTMLLRERRANAT